MSSEECDDFLALLNPESYERSSNVGGMDERGRFLASKDVSRTSENAWCDKECAAHPLAKRIAARIEEITGIPENSSEYLQVLRYRVGEYYKVWRQTRPPLCCPWSRAAPTP